MWLKSIPVFDPRPTIHFDDGRRWLQRNPKETCDLVVMNITRLLGRDFIDILKSHMNPGAVLACNSTYSPDVYQTAAETFKHVWAGKNFVIAGDTLAIPTEEDGIQRIAALRLDGRPLADPGRPQVAAKIREKVRSFEPFPALKNRYGRPLEVIADQNMITEYRYGKSSAKIFMDQQ